MIHFEVSGNTPFGAAALVDTQVQGFPAMVYAFNGTTFDRVRSNSAANLALVTQPGGMLVANPGEWTIKNAPAVNTQATATKAAGGAGVRHVCRAFFATLVGTGATAILDLAIRDGASGGGTILWDIYLELPAANSNGNFVFLSGLNFIGSAATAMTIEFNGGGGANTFQSVGLAGYSTI